MRFILVEVLVKFIRMIGGISPFALRPHSCIFVCVYVCMYSSSFPLHCFAEKQKIETQPKE